MPNASILAALGLFVRRGFLDPESSRSICREMSSAARTPAILRGSGRPDGILNETVRRTGVAQVSAATTTLIRGRLQAIKPALEAHFHVQLAGYQGPEFYVYDEGDFFLPHKDRSTDPLTADEVKIRQVSVSVFLNDESDGLDRESYRGGALVFYGARGDSDEATFGIPLEGEEGLFVAFRSDWTHEVRPITSGRRYAIVTWFF
jgi:predicted 2-oxoglutarate/Fe(II)-dependent dioxygenase YbiX